MGRQDESRISLLQCSLAEQLCPNAGDLVGGLLDKCSQVCVVERGIEVRVELLDDPLESGDSFRPAFVNGK